MRRVLLFNFSSCAFLHFIVPSVLANANNSTESQHESYIIHLEGKTVDEFTAVKRGLQDLLAALAINYCNSTGLKYSGYIDSSTVEIHNIVRCPTDWPLSDHCVSVNLSIPLDTPGDYELSTNSLHNVWLTHTAAQLTELGLQEYEKPSSSTILILWMCITGILFLLFLVILVFVIKTQFIEKYIRRRREMMGLSNKEWLAQNSQNQLVPPFFGPDPSDPKDVEDHTIFCNMRNDGFGIENPGYLRDSQIPQGTNIVDDFDSEDDTIYPPSPLPPPPSLSRTQHTSRKTTKEQETAF